MSPDTLALTVAQRCGGRFSFDDGSRVIDGLSALGYQWLPPGSLGRFADSDENKYRMIQAMAARTGLHREVVKDILTAAEQAGYRPAEPDQHPSGLKTGARAFEDVTRSASQHRKGIHR
jgi:hypothetical protein